MLKLKTSKNNISTEDFDFRNNSKYEEIVEETWEDFSLHPFIRGLKDCLDQSFILTSLGIICSLACVWFFSTYVYYSIGYSMGLLDVY